MKAARMVLLVLGLVLMAGCLEPAFATDLWGVKGGTWFGSKASSQAEVTYGRFGSPRLLPTLAFKFNDQRGLDDVSLGVGLTYLARALHPTTFSSLVAVGLTQRIGSHSDTFEYASVGGMFLVGKDWGLRADLTHEFTTGSKGVFIGLFGLAR